MLRIHMQVNHSLGTYTYTYFVNFIVAVQTLIAVIICTINLVVFIVALFYALIACFKVMNYFLFYFISFSYRFIPR